MKKNFEATAMAVRAAVAQLFFVAGLCAAIYGVHLWSRPLAWVLGGVVVSGIAFLAGYDSGSLRIRR